MSINRLMHVGWITPQPGSCCKHHWWALCAVRAVKRVRFCRIAVWPGCGHILSCLHAHLTACPPFLNITLTAYHPHCMHPSLHALTCERLEGPTMGIAEPALPSSLRNTRGMGMLPPDKLPSLLLDMS